MMNAKKLSGILLFLITTSVMGQEVNFIFKPVAKKKYEIQANSQSDLVQSMSGMEIKVNVKITANAMTEIEEVAPNGDFTTLTTWNDMKTFTSAMGKDTTIHAENMNIVMKTTYDKLGKMIKTERVNASQSQDLAITMVEQIAKSMKLPALPGKKVKKDESWESQSTDTIQQAEFQISLITNTDDAYSFIGTETFDGVEYYRINRSSPTKVTGGGEQGGMKMQVEGTGMCEGFHLLDKTTLLPAKIEEKTGMDMSLMVSGMQSMAIPITQNSVTKITFTEVK